MLMFAKHGKALIALAVATSMVALACGVAFATTPQEPAQQEAAPASGDRLTMAEWAELYPDQYASYATPRLERREGRARGPLPYVPEHAAVGPRHPHLHEVQDHPVLRDA